MKRRPKLKSANCIQLSKEVKDSYAMVGEQAISAGDRTRSSVGLDNRAGQELFNDFRRELKSLDFRPQAQPRSRRDWLVVVAMRWRKKNFEDLGQRNLVSDDMCSSSASDRR